MPSPFDIVTPSAAPPALGALAITGAARAGSFNAQLLRPRARTRERTRAFHRGDGQTSRVASCGHPSSTEISMSTRSSNTGDPEASGLTRVQLLQRSLAAGLAVGATSVFANGALGAPRRAKASQLGQELAKAGGVNPFRVKGPHELLAALQRQIDATRLPSMELVSDR